jgi:hypothetical protein
MDNITPGTFLVTFCGAYADRDRGFRPQDGPGWSQTEVVDSHEAAFEARARMERECREIYGEEYMRWSEISEESSPGEFTRWNYTDYSQMRERREAMRRRLFHNYH